MPIPPALRRRSPLDHQVHGIDVARFQTSIDWQQARANGVNFASSRPPKAAIWSIRCSVKTGVARRGPGAAWGLSLLLSLPPRRRTGRLLHPQCAAHPRRTAPVLDMEWTPFSPTCTIRRAPDVLRAEAKIFLDIVERHYGQRPIIYSTVDFYQENRCGASAISLLAARRRRPPG